MKLKQRFENLALLFYKPFQKFLPQTLFLYAFFGAANLLLDITLYYISFHYILNEEIIHIGAIAISPHIAAFLCAFCVTFPIGFLSMRHIVFKAAADTKARLQAFRYFMVVIMNICLNYVLLKLLVEHFHIFPTPSKMLTAIVVVTITYFVQKRFTFKEDL
jgi:putative flippase GtrA